MKVAIYNDEWYPVYQITPDKENFYWNHNEAIVDISLNEFMEYEELMKKFDEWQDKLIKLSREEL